MARVSVVVPTYNGSSFIKETLASVFAQTSLPGEVLVVDDASRDGTPEVVRAMANSAPVPIRLIVLSSNSGGPAHPLNVGIEAASGELISVLDQDDLFLPDRLESMVPVLASHPNMAFVFSAYGMVGKPASLVAPGLALPLVRQLMAADQDREQGSVIDGREAARWLLLHGNYVVGYPGFVFRRDSWKRKGGLDETLRISSDYDFLCWLCLGGAVGFIPRILCLRRIHERNLSATGIRGYLELARLVVRYVEEVAAGTECHQFWQGFRRPYLAMLIALGWLGYPREALGQFHLVNQTWGVRWDSWRFPAQLLVGSLRGRLKRGSRVEGAEVDEFVECLYELLRIANRQLLQA
jgi:glycosyltransferase involved in cell wall biosynthesis